MSARTRAYLMMIATTAMWGVAGPIIKSTLDHFDVVTFLLYRFLLTSMILIPILVITSKNVLHLLHELTPRQWLFFILSSFVGSTLQLGLLFWGYTLTSSFEGTLISSTAPVFVTLTGYIFLHERVTLRERWGLGVAFLGSLIIVLEPILKSGANFTLTNVQGNFLILLATFSVALHALLIKTNLRTRLSPFLMTTTMFFVGFISISPIAFIFSSPLKITTNFTSAPLAAHLGVFYMAIFSGALAYWFYHKAQKTIEISEANLFHYLTPLFAAPLSFLWLKEPASTFMFIGIVITIIGVAIAEIKKFK